jgi:hypothetical protein
MKRGEVLGGKKQTMDQLNDPHRSKDWRLHNYEDAKYTNFPKLKVYEAIQKIPRRRSDRMWRIKSDTGTSTIGGVRELPRAYSAPSF